MASIAESTGGYRSDQSFFVKLSTYLAIFIVFGFVQWAARGMVDFRQVPFWIHLHGLAMVSWLAIFVIQNRSAASGDLDRHRKLGWIAAYLVAAIVGLGCFAGIMALRHHTQPPFFTEAYFLALTQVDAVVFGGLVYAGVTRRNETEHHRRLMTGAVVVIMEPALGRLLPMPFMHGMGEWAIMAIQLGVMGVVALHDRKTLGRVHQATATVAAIIAVSHVLIEFSGRNPYVQQIAARIAGA